jgi:hypothetical protein
MPTSCPAHGVAKATVFPATSRTILPALRELVIGPLPRRDLLADVAALRPDLLPDTLGLRNLSTLLQGVLALVEHVVNDGVA